MILISCVFKTNVGYIVNISNYKKEQLKLHQLFFGVKGGGAKNSPLKSPTINIFRTNFS